MAQLKECGARADARQMGEIQRAVCVLVALTALAAPAAHAEDTYRWLDAQGGIHFGAEPPPDARDVRKVDGSSGGSINVIPHDGLAAPPTRATGAAAPVLPPPAAGALAPAEATSIGGRSEDSWRSEALRLARRIESVEADIERADDARRNAISMSSTAYYERRIARLEQQLEAARGALDALEERARKLEVPPGWLR